MPNRLSKILSRSSYSKDKEAEAEAERTKSNSPPPQYGEQPPQYDADNTLAPPDITAGFNNLNLNRTSELPQSDQCIAHLKVLECFYRLRQKIGSTDGLYGIENNVVLEKVSRSANEQEKSELLAKLAEKRWAIYVALATDRFETWSASINPGAQMARCEELEKAGKEGLLCEPPNSKSILTFDKTNMPPVDVLMVWHAYMLNPRAYLEDCLRLGRMNVWQSGMPWQASVDCINSETFAYEAGEEAEGNFTSLTGLPWDNVDRGTKTIDCSDCRGEVAVPYTTCMQYASTMHSGHSIKQSQKAVDDMLASGSGYYDKDFSASCTRCKTLITHESLKAAKFCSDLEKLLDSNTPMGGTLLGMQGIPGKFEGVTDSLASSMCAFPNLLLAKGLGAKILNSPGVGKKSMEGIRDFIEDAIKNRAYLREVRSSASGRMYRHERIGIRRMMSRYWDNSSPFALDLVGAVIRQGSFIEKMHSIDWLHSPALPSTMHRLLVKYSRFVSIMANPLHMAVPTLDVDLAWHTHQLSPYTYMKYTVQNTKQFIDHNDKVAETKLNDAFAWTSKTYQKTYGEPYSECTCWYCEAIRESHTNAASRMFNSSNNQANALLHDSAQDPRKSAHISTHNAVRPDDAKYKAEAALKADQLEKQYQKACERARKKGKREPKRDDYYYSDAWGYPVYIPAYSPYIGFYPYTPMYYPIAPGCMALTAGSAGNCCSGTCGGAVAAGGCGGAGGGCAGGAAGGCAAAGGCGGGGGGGCGGGGGGCGGGGGG